MIPVSKAALDFVKSAGTLALGSAAGQVITVAASPALTRLYSPESLGSFGTFLGIAAIFVSVACLRFEQAILLESSEAAIRKIGFLCLMTACGLSLVVAGISTIAHVSISAHLGSELSYALIWATPPLIIMNGLYTIVQFRSIHVKSYKDVVLYQIIRSVFVCVIQISFALFISNVLSLIIGQIIGVAVANLYLYFISKFAIFEFYGKKEIWELVKKYLHFPLYGATQSVFNGISGAIPTTLLTIFFAPSYAGLFWLAYRMLSLPNLIIIESIRGALFSELSERVREDRGIIRPMIIMSMVLGVFCLPISVFLFLFGEQVFSFVFGQYWNDAGRYAAIISVGWIVQNMAVPASVALVLLHRQRSYLALEVGLTVARVCGFAISAMWFSAEFAVVIYTSLGAVHAAIVQIYAYGSARSRWRVTKQMEPA